MISSDLHEQSQLVRKYMVNDLIRLKKGLQKWGISDRDYDASAIRKTGEFNGTRYFYYDTARYNKGMEKVLLTYSTFISKKNLRSKTITLRTAVPIIDGDRKAKKMIDLTGTSIVDIFSNPETNPYIEVCKGQRRGILGYRAFFNGKKLSNQAHIGPWDYFKVDFGIYDSTLNTSQVDGSEYHQTSIKYSNETGKWSLWTFPRFMIDQPWKKDTTTDSPIYPSLLMNAMDFWIAKTDNVPYAETYTSDLFSLWRVKFSNGLADATETWPFDSDGITTAVKTWSTPILEYTKEANKARLSPNVIRGVSSESGFLSVFASSELGNKYEGELSDGQTAIDQMSAATTILPINQIVGATYFMNNSDMSLRGPQDSIGASLYSVLKTSADNPRTDQYVFASMAHVYNGIKVHYDANAYATHEIVITTSKGYADSDIQTYINVYKFQETLTTQLDKGYNTNPAEFLKLVDWTEYRSYFNSSIDDMCTADTGMGQATGRLWAVGYDPVLGPSTYQKRGWMMDLGLELFEGLSGPMVGLRPQSFFRGEVTGLPVTKLNQDENAPMATWDSYNRSFTFDVPLTRDLKYVNVPGQYDTQFRKLHHVTGRANNDDNPWYQKNDKFIVHSEDEYFIALDTRHQRFFRAQGSTPNTIGWIEFTIPYLSTDFERIRGVTSYKNVVIFWGFSHLYFTIDFKKWWREVPLPIVSDPSSNPTSAWGLSYAHANMATDYRNTPTMFKRNRYDVSQDDMSCGNIIEEVKVWNGYVYVCAKHMPFYAITEAVMANTAINVICRYHIYRKKYPIFNELTDYVSPYDVYKNQEFLDIYGDKRRGFRTNPEFLTGGARFSRAYNLPVYPIYIVNGLTPRDVRMTYESILNCVEYHGDMYVLKVRFTLMEPQRRNSSDTPCESITADPKTSVRSEIRLERLYPNLTNPTGGTYSEPIFILNRDNVDSILFEGAMSTSKFCWNDFLLWETYDQSGLYAEYMAFGKEPSQYAIPSGDFISNLANHFFIFTVANDELLFGLKCISNKYGVYDPAFTATGWYDFYKNPPVGSSQVCRFTELVLFTYDGEVFGLPQRNEIYDTTNSVMQCFGHDANILYRLAVNDDLVVGGLSTSRIVSVCEYPEDGPAIYSEVSGLETTDGLTRKLIVSAAFADRRTRGAATTEHITKYIEGLMGSSTTPAADSCPYMAMMPWVGYHKSIYLRQTITDGGITVHRTPYYGENSIPWMLYNVMYKYRDEKIRVKDAPLPIVKTTMMINNSLSVNIFVRRYDWVWPNGTATSPNPISTTYSDYQTHFPLSCGVNLLGLTAASRMANSKLSNSGIVGIELMKVHGLIFIKTCEPDMPILLYDPSYKLLRKSIGESGIHEAIQTDQMGAKEHVIEPIIPFTNNLAAWFSTDYDKFPANFKNYFFNDEIKWTSGNEPVVLYSSENPSDPDGNTSLYRSCEYIGGNIVDVQYRDGRYYFIGKYGIYSIAEEFFTNPKANRVKIYKGYGNYIIPGNEAWESAGRNMRFNLDEDLNDLYRIDWLDPTGGSSTDRYYRTIEAVPGRKPIYMNGYWFLPWAGYIVDENGNLKVIPDSSEFSRNEWSPLVATRADKSKSVTEVAGVYSTIEEPYSAMASLADIYNAGSHPTSNMIFDIARTGENATKDPSATDTTQISTLPTLLSHMRNVTSKIPHIMMGQNYSYWNQFYKWKEKVISLTPCKYGYMYDMVNTPLPISYFVDPFLVIPRVDMWQHVAMTDYSGKSPKFIHKKVQIQDYEYNFESDNSIGLSARPMTINNKDFYVLDLPFHPTKVIVLNRDQKTIISEYPEFYFEPLTTRYLKSGKEVDGITKDPRLEGASYHAVYIPFKQNAKTIYEANHLDVLDDKTGMIPDVESFIDNNRVYIYNPRPTQGPLTKTHVQTESNVNSFVKYPGVYKDYLPTQSVNLSYNGNSTSSNTFQKGYQFSTLEIFAWS